MPERESDKEALAHLVITVSHLLQSRLLVVHLLVLGHVCFVAKVVKVASVGFRVQLWNKRRPSLSKRLPLDLCKVVMVVNILDVRETACSRVDAAYSLVSKRFTSIY